jgi:hypothetical protein
MSQGKIRNRNRCFQGLRKTTGVDGFDLQQVYNYLTNYCVSFFGYNVYRNTISMHDTSIRVD